MDKEQVLKVKELIKYGFDLANIATEFQIPIEQLEELKKQIEEEKKAKANKQLKKESEKTELKLEQKKEEEKSKSRREIQDMLKRYEEIFGDSTKKTQNETSKGELSEKELENAIQKLNLLIERLKNKGNLPMDTKTTELEKLISAYRRLIENDLMKKAHKAESVEELKCLSAKVPTPIYGVGSVEGYIRNKIARIQQQALMDNIRNNIPEEIEKIIADIASGEIDIQHAREVIEEEARKKVENSNGSKFKLTLDGQRRQILTQIHTALKEKADKYVIKSSTQAINNLTQLGGTSQIQAVNIVTQNLCGRKEYSRALAICEMSYKNLNEEGIRQVRLLKRQIKAAKLGDLAQKMLTGTKSIEEREAEYENLKTAMKVEDLKPSQILIGKINDGSVQVYLNKILVDEKQR